MAFATTETTCTPITAGGTELLLLVGTYASSAGDTGGVITPGTPSSGNAADNSSYIRKITGSLFNATSASPGAVREVTSYDATGDRDIVTITTSANQTGQYFILGFNAGG